MHAYDLTKYNFHLPYELDCVLMVGWLDSDHDYIRGEVATADVTKLERLIKDRSHSFDLHVNVVRGIHPCNLCGELVTYVDEMGRTRSLGFSEIWIPCGAIWYATPSLILHYIERHHYCPPSEFLHAIRFFDLNANVIAQVAYDTAIQKMPQFKSY